MSSFTPESKAYQIGMRHACTGNTNRSHKHGKKRADRNGVRFAPRRILHVIAWGLLRCNTRRTSVASQKIPRDDMQYLSLGSLSAEPANATWCLQQHTSQGKRDLLVLCYSVDVVDCWHLQKQACQTMNASLRTENRGEQMAPYRMSQIFTTPS